MARRTNGTVRWFDGSKGYGYINTEAGQEVFVHCSAIAGQGLKFLLQGERVEFDLEDTYRGLEAAQVVRLH